MSYVRVWVHLVFATKYRYPYFNSAELRKQIFEHIKANGREKEIWIDAVNGYEDHVHILFSLGREQTISKVAQLLKGESSFWINKNQLTKKKFLWQDDYWAAGVSERNLEQLRNYIKNQEEHHQKKNLSEEVENLFKNQEQ
ncbi:IS200/IS605 family transposase [Antarcticibacterium sp. 1MA-6-2]|uniref:IS200/IS605 family transposase n=1 Tax=Antarcticibacterium sp. 1MA-6-2 TaxID=2908210 RepID=UPI001F45A683|nr:IS200/IS605 family transposase [Antarcticibacterium sp. 1MA-6-2]UJH92376.1 IS200/IS605 family transposase [Antarcticibacterium sp. 1MA-6-2]